ncbi:DUF4046 domain-containing protein [Priestia megaterium]|uniref:DUF4046 domain-containing protein n=1 Tax=Priestia megaterium TaxID=1404 RepID=UPI00207A8A1D|nr:DUF4046 domain-containing protein [Priestia megaterium]USL45586.1 DUF4046 domain-containing protein [Priestia megaterium]
MNREEVIEMYSEALEGKRRRFPDGFFIGEEGKKYLAYMTRYLLEELLSIKVNDIPLKVKASTLWSHRLKSPANLHGWNYYDVIQNAYPGKFKPWEFQQVPNGYWIGEKGRKRAIQAVQYVIEVEVEISLEDIPSKINHHFFKKHRLLGVFSVFEQSPFKVIDAVYPGIFKPWQFNNVVMNCWKDPVHIEEIMEWFLFQQLGFFSYAEAYIKIQVKHFFKYRLTGLYQRAFNSRLERVKQWISMEGEKEKRTRRRLETKRDEFN